MTAVMSLPGKEAGSARGSKEAYDAASQDVEARLDEALCETFPASDPIAVSPEGR
jgi:hypothetical protein